MGMERGRRGLKEKEEEILERRGRCLFSQALFRVTIILSFIKTVF